VIDDIVRLGEGYSIATEYTSFLVLENDAEFQRWKIARNNVLRTDRDRKAQEVVRSQLDAMRNKALADLGPQPDRPLLAVARPSQPPTLAAPQRAPSPQNVAPAIAPAPRSRQSSDFGLGSGPVGPLFLGLLLWVRRLRQKKA
jgi:hypothetical protein